MGPLLRAEPERPKFMEGCPQLKSMLRRAWWLQFIQKFRGYNKEVTKTFARNFDGMEVEVGDLEFSVIEAPIVAATKLPREGERWFKNKSFYERAWRVILRNPGMDITIFKRGTPVSALEEKCASLLLIIHKFIPCEGRFGSMYMYHTQLLMNFLEKQTINLPYFLLNSLKKMSIIIQNNLGDVEPHLYHHGLVKILIEKQLKEKKDTWEQFLVRNFFQDPHETPENISSRKSRRKKESVRIQDTPTNIVKETSREEKLSESRKERTEGKKPRKSKRKRNIEAVYQTPEPSSEEDHQILSKRLVYFKEQSTAAKKKGKEK